ncbi:MAG: DUF3240 family protein [Zoogloea sp.]|nr:DUF3240 family protein [Zoogloea sp.]
MTPDTLLTLIIPTELEAALIDELLENPDLAPGFTTNQVEGHGTQATFFSPGESVRGRADRIRLELLLDAPTANRLIAHVQMHFSHANVFWWMSPAITGGRLT